ncbi:diguanylate cyclase (plasmid) [Lichenicola cladoniae]|uniref:diguanylate cyclase n=1 Tax=Lichenicola cladoniae TaxID=1484109 RepID=A0A6M8I0G7_9PROT|nr:diguanylate cyclase [Lichenicola cladoniae]NPD69884.1 diguanylate cyclase [Acetobacteraceae bacterium]QKE93906.1 diguanylate cyclase [Lichenicola cladoniae]
MKLANPLSARLLTRYYVTALLIIAGLTISSHLLLTYVLQHNHGTAAIINVSGRQRMLSQRIASLAAQYRLGDKTAHPALVAAIDEFEATEATLSKTSRAITRSNAETLQIQNIYTRSKDSLDAEARDFVTNARQVANLAPADPAARPPLDHVFAAARLSLLSKLNEIVAIHQRETEHVLAELEVLQQVILGVVLSTLIVEALMIFRPMIHRIVLYTSEVMRLATIDSLTGLSNRRGFLERCEMEHVRATRYNRPLCLLMLDADNFKQINDIHGHQAGDEVLRAMSSSFQEILRGSDFAGRLGGEEFAVLAPETDLAGARLLAERLRLKVASKPILIGRREINVTVSIGVTSVLNDANGIGHALREADVLMYRAKHGGRNLVVSAEALLPN